MSHETERAAVRQYVLTMLSGIPRDGLFTPEVQAALEHNILSEQAEISDELILAWYAAIFESADVETLSVET